MEINKTGAVAAVIIVSITLFAVLVTDSQKGPWTISDTVQSQIDTVIMVERQHGFFGVGTVTKVTFQHGIYILENRNATSDVSSVLGLTQNYQSNYTVNPIQFNGDLDVHAGGLYNLTYRLETFRDNSTKVTPMTITYVSEAPQ